MSRFFITLDQFRAGVAVIRDETEWDLEARRFRALDQDVKRSEYLSYTRFLLSKVQP